MKKAFGQTVRELKREVNKKVLKVPGIERKVLDATSNEPWGPHGSLLADIAQASRNYHEYQMIMSVLWKRINDTGKNWRHVYKALTVLDYLVAHGSERVIDEIKEHAYQISTLSEFQYIDSSGKDQGSNVRKKSQSLVALVNDRERIQEVRQKATTNRDKFRNAPGDGMYRPGPNSSPGNYGDRYDDNQHEARYGNREDDRNGYGREREGAYRDDDQYSSRDGDRYSRDSDERHSNDYQGRGSTDDYQYSSRSSDRERERGYEDDGQYSSRGSGARADDRSQDGSYSDKGIDRKFSEQNLGAPPSYEDAVGDAHSPVQSERDGDTAATSAPPVNATSLANPESGTGPSLASPPAPSLDPASPPAPAAAPTNPVADNFDEFDPRSSFPAPQTTSSGADMDFLGSLSESFSAEPLAIMPATSASTASGVNELDSFASGPAFSATPPASNGTNQGFDDPFGDGPFRALPSADNSSAPPQNHNNNSSLAQPVTQNAQTADFGEASSGFTHTPSSNPYSQFPSTNTQFSTQEPTTSHQDIDILADILPLAGPPQVAPQSGFPVQSNQPASVNGFQAQPDQSMSMVPFSVPASQSGPQASFPAQPNHSHFPGQPGQLPSMAGFQSGHQTQFPVQSGHPSSQFGFPSQSHTGYSAQVSQSTPQPGFMAHPGQHAQYPAQSVAGFTGQLNSAGQAGVAAPSHHPWNSGGNYPGSVQQTGYAAAPSQTAARPAQQNTANFHPQNNPAASASSSQSTSLTLTGPGAQPNNDVMGNSSSSAIVSQPAKTKFEPKSSIWADTLSRGLVDFNISGAKVNPTNNLGIDFDAINRKEKRMEKPTAATATAVTSTINMGKAMGSGSGMGRAGAGALRASANPMMSPGMGMGGGPGVNMGMGGGPGGNMGMGGGPGGNMVGMGGGRGVNMGMGGGPGVNMGMGGGPGVNMGMGGYGGMNQPMGGGMNMPGMNMGMNPGMGMNMGMGQGPQMQPTGFPPGAAMPGGYNPMMGRGGGGGYGPQQPYGGGFQ